MTIPPCPNCKKLANVFVVAQCSGQNELTYSLDGGLVEVNYDRLRYKHNKRVYCCGCGELRRDLRCTEGGDIYEKREATQ